MNNQRSSQSKLEVVADQLAVLTNLQQEVAPPTLENEEARRRLLVRVVTLLVQVIGEQSEQIGTLNTEVARLSHISAEAAAAQEDSTQPGKKALEVFNNILSEAEDSEASSLPTTKFEALVEEIGEGFHGDELEKQLTLVDPEHTGKIGKTAFVKWYCNLVDQEGDDSSQETEVAQEKANAEEAFQSFSNGSPTILASDFGKLIESMGSTYCEEEHRRTIKKISTEDESGNRIVSKESFVAWYIEWLFGDEESSDSD